MKHALLQFCLLLGMVTQGANAQHQLSRGRTGSAVHHIYQLTAREAVWFYKAGEDDIMPESYLHTLVATFPDTLVQLDKLPPGNYVEVAAVAGQLQYTFRPVNNVRYKVINNNYDLAVFLHDMQGEGIKNAVVALNGKNIPFDEATMSYRLKGRHRASGILRVQYNNVQNYFKITTTAPLKVWWKRWWHGCRRAVHTVLRKKQRYTSYNGYMVTNKPVYKPGDTVRLKAFVANPEGAPVQQPLVLRLADRTHTTDTVIASLSPYRAGGYDYYFVLSDSMDIELDEDYSLTLETPESLQVDKLLNEPKGNTRYASKAALAGRRKVVAQASFTYEEYELKSIKFEGSTNKKKHVRGEQVALYIKGTDENGLPVPDGRLEILLKSQLPDNYYRDHVFVPDTLWYQELPLEATGETKVVLPDSIFPAVDMSYLIEARLLNSSNEAQHFSLKQEYFYEPGSLHFRGIGDSIQISYTYGGRDTVLRTTLAWYNSADEKLTDTLVQLPVTLKVPSLAKTCTVYRGDYEERYDLTQLTPGIFCDGSRTEDSVFLQVINPHQLHFWYTILEGNRVLSRGYAEKLQWRCAAASHQLYSLSLQYIWNDQLQREEYFARYEKDKLKLEVTSPAVAYPGQEIRIGINVKDMNGAPVADADVTAYGITSKFQQYSTPQIRTKPVRQQGRKAFPVFELKEAEKESNFLFLQWERWSRKLGLDSMEYYRFLHPLNSYTCTETVPDSITQLAPFLTQNGRLVPVHMLWIDDVPVYFSWVGHDNRYSFRVTPGKHRLRLRTASHLVTVDSVMAVGGRKTFISLNMDLSNPLVRMEKRPDVLLPEEIATSKRYIIPFEVPAGSRYTFVTQGNNIFWLKRPAYHAASSILAGPLTGQTAFYQEKENLLQEFTPEPGFSFKITKGLIKQRETRTWLYPKRLFLPVWNYSLRDVAVTHNEINAAWQRDVNNSSLAGKMYDVPSDYPRLIIAWDTGIVHQDIKQLFLFHYDQPDFMNIYRPDDTDLGRVQPAASRLLVLMKDQRYYLFDSLKVTGHGICFYRLQPAAAHAPDTMSRRLTGIINDNYIDKGAYTQSVWMETTGENMSEAFNRHYLPSSSFTRQITGTVTDTDGQPLPGAMVKIGGTNKGVITRPNGNFLINVPDKGVLVVSFIGYNQQRIALSAARHYRIVLNPDSKHLEEVVVTGYGARRQANMTGAVSVLSGNGGGIRIRGNNAMGNQKPSLIMVDGMPYAGKLTDISPDEIATMQVIKGSEATALYGAAAAGGVIIITSVKKTGTQEEGIMPAGSIRRNFRDDAFWQPRLRTNEAGATGFSVTLPDDITSWRAIVLAMSGGKQSGITETAIRSFKTLTAGLALPAFAIAGDTVQVIAKTMHYAPDSLPTLRREFRAGITEIISRNSGLRHAVIDTFLVRIPATDSMLFRYSLTAPNGYTDGEERSIPVLPAGTVTTDGFFTGLYRDTTFTIPLPADTGRLFIYAVNSVMPVLEEEMRTIVRYPYDCNEQLASKLMAALMSHRLAPQAGDDKTIRQYISRLNQRKHRNGLWGWWQDDGAVPWISLHVIKSLLLAEESGYTVSGFDRQRVIDHIVYKLPEAGNGERLTMLEMLMELKSGVNYQSWLDSIRVTKEMLLYDKLRLMLLKQRTGIAVNTDSLLAHRSISMFGNEYWGEDSYRFFDNSIQHTLLVYRLLRAQGGHDELLEKIRGWLLEQRRGGSWRNTYESAGILSTILPDMKAVEKRPPTLVVAGKKTTRFPYADTLLTSSPVSIQKTDGGPVYLTAWRQRRDPAPARFSNRFTVRSEFIQQHTPVTRLKAGTPVSLQVTVDVEADADYVMVEVPVPAGCSYENKRQHHDNGEVHREYFKDRVSIFCGTLTKGRHHFTVSLMPRFSGQYHLNPAKAAMMYFPVFNGREALRHISIGGQ